MTAAPSTETATTAGPPSARTVGWAALVLWAVGSVVVLALPPGSARTVAVNLLSALLFAVAAWGSRRRRRSSPHAVAWRFLEAAAVMGLAVGVIYALRSLLSWTADPLSLTLAHGLTIGYPVAVVASLLAAIFRRAASGKSRIEGALEGTVLATSSFAFLWLLGFREVAEGLDPSLASAATLAPFVLSAAALGLAVYLHASLSFAGPLGYVAAWAGLGVVSEALYAYLIASGTWFAGHPVEVLGVVRVVPLCIAPWLPSRPWLPREQPSHLARDLLLLIPVAVVLILTTTQGLGGTLVYDGVIVTLFLAIGFGILARQYVALGVARELSDDLERRVRERTEALQEAMAALEQTQRLEAVGRLAGGVAHDFNNLLTAIGGNTELVLETLPPGDARREDLVAVELAVSRGTALTRKLLTFARRDAAEIQVVDLNGAVEETCSFLARVLPDGVELHTELEEGLPPLEADPGHLDQLVTNLVLNARDAVAREGNVTVRTQRKTVDDRLASSHGVSPGPYLCLSVTDDGTGIPSGMLERLFEPFFTTKPVGEGTGLGLASCYGIVTGQDGFITVETTPGQGSTFRCWLPEHPG